ncbi:MAG: hypothetical protein ACI81S_002031, partial [Sphingobacteriales bacterium]
DEAAGDQDFFKAAKYRDEMFALEKIYDQKFGK